MCAEQFIKTGEVFLHFVSFIVNNLPVDQLEQERLNGQNLQGVATTQEVNTFLKAKEKVSEFPLFSAVHKGRNTGIYSDGRWE